MGWKPIETASRDIRPTKYDLDAMQNGTCAVQVNTAVLLWGSPFFEQTQSIGKARCFCGYWSIMHDRWVETMQGMTDDGVDAYEIIPTHWMPLPDAPTEAST